MESLQSKVIVQTDHSAILDITQQSSITLTSSTMRMNVQLVRASHFFCQFSKLEIRHKPGKEHIIPDAFSRLASANTNLLFLDLDALLTYTPTFIDIYLDLIKRIIDGYEANEWWSRLLRQVEDNEAFDNDKAILSFLKEIPILTDSDPYFTPRPEL